MHGDGEEFAPAQSVENEVGAFVLDFGGWGATAVADDGREEARYVRSGDGGEDGGGLDGQAGCESLLTAWG